MWGERLHPRQSSPAALRVHPKPAPSGLSPQPSEGIVTSRGGSRDHRRVRRFEIDPGAVRVRVPLRGDPW